MHSCIRSTSCEPFLNGTVAVGFSVSAHERYDFISRIVHRFGYARLRRCDKGVVLLFLGRVSGYSRAQLTRLIERGRNPAPLVKRDAAQRIGFTRTYQHDTVCTGSWCANSTRNSKMLCL